MLMGLPIAQHAVGAHEWQCQHPNRSFACTEIPEVQAVFEKLSGKTDCSWVAQSRAELLHNISLAVQMPELCGCKLLLGAPLWVLISDALVLFTVS